MRRPAERVAAYVERVLGGRRPPRFAASPEERQALAGAGLLASVTADVLPDPRFLERLHSRLQADLEPRWRRPLSRRALLLASGSAAVTAIAGSLGGFAIAEARAAPRPAAPRTLEPDAGRWLAAASSTELPPGTIKPFVSENVHLMLVNDNGRIRALSGSCTHLGCLLRPSGSTLACPCHRTRFGLDGQVLTHELPEAPPRLPEARTRVVDGQIEVFAV